MELNRLMVIEEKIENCFIALASLEVSGKKESYDYEEHFRILNDLIREEKNLLESLNIKQIIEFREQVLKHCNKKETTLALGYLTNASYTRVLHLLDTLFGSEFFNYATYLRYDLNQIILSFLEYLIANDYYEDIRNDLIFYKYNLIFMNFLSENDFLNTDNPSIISVESKSFKTDAYPDLIFVDKAVLVLEGKEFISTIDSLNDDFRLNNKEYALAVIAIIELLARLTLSEDDVLHYLQQDFDLLLQDDNVSIEVKNLIQEMVIILEQFKDKISVTR